MSATPPAPSWGRVNAVLNRLRREGVIAGYWTNLGHPSRALGLHVIVARSDGADREDTRAAVTRALACVAPRSTVTVADELPPRG